MTITEKVAYLKGLAAGLGIDDTTPQGKLNAAIIDALDDIALTVSDLEDTVDAVCDQVDELDDDVTALNEIIDDECDCDECSDDDDDEEEEMYKLVCPNCSKEIMLAESILDDGELSCPNCGEKIEFEVLDEDDDEAAAEDEAPEDENK